MYAVNRNYIPLKTTPEIVAVDCTETVLPVGDWEIFQSFELAKKHAAEVMSGDLEKLKLMISNVRRLGEPV